MNEANRDLTSKEIIQVAIVVSCLLVTIVAARLFSKEIAYVVFGAWVIFGFYAMRKSMRNASPEHKEVLLHEIKKQEKSFVGRTINLMFLAFVMYMLYTIVVEYIK